MGCDIAYFWHKVLNSDQRVNSFASSVQARSQGGGVQVSIMSISTTHYSNIASKASVSQHFLCVQCARLAIMAMAGRNGTPQILRLATGLDCGSKLSCFIGDFYKY